MILFQCLSEKEQSSLAVLGFSRPFFLRHVAPLSLVEFIHLLKLSASEDFLERVDQGEFDFLQDQLGVEVKTKIESFAKAHRALQKYGDRAVVEDDSLRKHLGLSVDGNLLAENKLPSFFLRHVHCGAMHGFLSFKNSTTTTADANSSIALVSNHLPYVEALLQTLEGGEQVLMSAAFIRQNMGKLVAEHNLLLLSRFFDDYRERSRGLWVDKNASVHETVVASDNGFTVVTAQAAIGPFVHLTGANYIGNHTAVKSGSMLCNVSLGHCCRIGGELTSTSIDDYSNKTHYGFIGHTIVGSWVNIGAGTTFSNLKSTYGKGYEKKGYEDLGETNKKNRYDVEEELFFGSVVGDYAKLGINSTVFQKKTIGVGASVFGDIYRAVPHFYFSQNNFNSETDLTASAVARNRYYKPSFIKTQERMMARRALNLAKDEEVFLSKLHDALSYRSTIK